VSDRKNIGNGHPVWNGFGGIGDWFRDIERYYFYHLESRQEPDPALVPVLVELLHHPDYQVRRLAAGRLTNYKAGFPQALPVLLEGLQSDPDPKERDRILFLIGALGHEYPEAVKSAAPDLLAFHDREPDQEKRNTTVMALRSIDRHSPEWPPYVCDLHSEKTKFGTKSKNGLVVKFVSDCEGSTRATAVDPGAPSKCGCAVVLGPGQPDSSILPCIVRNFLEPKNFELRVAIRAVDGNVEQGGGVVWRFQDADNYYAAGVDPLHGTLSLYRVVAGRCTLLVAKDGLNLHAAQWHMLSVKNFGDRIECSVDGTKQLATSDSAIGKAGEVGFWTQGDAQTYFDALRVSEYGDNP
jgi:hypothetical protein